VSSCFSCRHDNRFWEKELSSPDVKGLCELAVRRSGFPFLGRRQNVPMPALPHLACNATVFETWPGPEDQVVGALGL